MIVLSSRAWDQERVDGSWVNDEAERRVAVAADGLFTAIVRANASTAPLPSPAEVDRAWTALCDMPCYASIRERG